MNKETRSISRAGVDKNIIIIHPRDISFNDLEVLTIQFKQETGKDVRIPSLPDYYLAYLAVQSLFLPLPRRSRILDKLEIDCDFFNWVKKKYGQTELKTRLLGRVKNELKRFKNYNFSQLQSDVLDVISNISPNRAMKNMAATSGVAPLSLEMVTSTIIDYFDPIKPYVDPISDFIQTINRERYFSRETGGNDIKKFKIQLLKIIVACIDNETFIALKKIKDIVEKSDIASKERISCTKSPDLSLHTVEKHINKLAGELNKIFGTNSSGTSPCIDEVDKKLTEIETLLSEDSVYRKKLSSPSSNIETFLDDAPVWKALLNEISINKIDHTIFEHLQCYCTDILEIIIHDHTLNRALSNKDVLSISLIDGNVNTMGDKIREYVPPELTNSTYVFMSSVTAEMPEALAIMKALTLIGIPAEQIVYGGMAVNALLPRETLKISGVMEDKNKLAALLKKAGVFTGNVGISLFFGMFDRPSANRFLDDFFSKNSEAVVGYGIRLAQDGAWLDEIKRDFVVWPSYKSSLFGLPAINVYMGLVISGGCPFSCNFCASIGSMTILRQRTAQDVFAQIRSYSNQLLWVETLFGKYYKNVLKFHGARKIFSFLNLFMGNNLAFNDDNLAHIHPWTLYYLKEYLKENKLFPVIWTQMDINTLESAVHKEFVADYVISTLIGIEAVKERYLDGLKKGPALLSLKNHKNESFQDDRLYEIYQKGLREFIGIGAIPISSLIIGLLRHDKIVEVADEIIEFINTPIRKYKFIHHNFFEKMLLKLAGNCPVQAQSMNFLSIYIGSPDAKLLYPLFQNSDNPVFDAARSLIAPGHFSYDIGRMSGTLPQVNFNAQRLALETMPQAHPLKKQRSMTGLNRCDTEDVILAQYYIDKTLSKNIASSALGSLVMAYIGKRSLPFVRRIVAAFKAPVMVYAFRITGKHKANCLTTLHEPIRWKTYRDTVSIKYEGEQISPDIRTQMEHFGFNVVKENGHFEIKMAKKEQFAEGFQNWIYESHGIDPETKAFSQEISSESCFRTLFEELRS